MRNSCGRVRYTGRVDRARFLAWSDSPEGRSALEPIASAIRFAPLGKLRAARRRVWRQLKHAARTDAAIAALQQETDSYLVRLDTLVYARDLPRVGVDLHRLVVVPRLFANAATERRVDAWLQAHDGFATLDGGKPVREWFALSLVDAIEAAVAAARPSPRHPLPAGDGWIVIGVNERFEWRVPLDGPAWPGHYYLLELTRMPITRAVRKAAGEAIARVEASLPGLSRVHRTEIVRQAALSLDQLARA